jgi:hypothetical protein
MSKVCRRAAKVKDTDWSPCRLIKPWWKHRKKKKPEVDSETLLKRDLMER